jgi:hypothetical protein
VIAPVAPPPLLASVLFAVLSDGAAAETAEGAVTPGVIMNPFGLAFVALTWLVLIGLNLWCLRKLLRNRPAGGTT